MPIDWVTSARVKTRQNATKRDAVQRIALRANMRAEPGGAAPRRRAQSRGALRPTGVAARTMLSRDGRNGFLMASRLLDLKYRYIRRRKKKGTPKKKRSFLYGQTDMPCFR